MNRALWRKAVWQTWPQLLVSGAGLFAFGWLFIWLIGQFDLGFFETVLSFLPSWSKSLMSVPPALLASRPGQITILFVHAITYLVCVGWALGRGSDPITGEISRGTIDLILSLPVRRYSVLVPPAVVTTLGSAVIALSLWAGIAAGVATVDLGSDVSVLQFWPAVLNLFAMVFCLTGVTTLISSLGRDRWRTIAWGGGFFVISLVLEMAARLWPEGWPEAVDVPKWLNRLTFLSVYRPQELTLVPEGGTALKCNLTLLAVGLAAYVAAGLILSRRDIPNPR